MDLDDTAIGSATLRSSATLGQIGRSGGRAPIGSFRLIPRDAEGTQSGANGGSAAGAPPATGNPPGSATPPATQQRTTSTATDDDDPELGDGGRKAIRAERDARKAATAELEAAKTRIAELESATQTESERAVNQARREAAAERDAHWSARIRDAEVRGALRGAGIANDRLLELTVLDERFRGLKVDRETGAVAGVAEAVAAFRTDVPEAFADHSKPKAATPPTQGGPWGGSEGGSGSGTPPGLEEAVMRRLATQQGR